MCCDTHTCARPLREDVIRRYKDGRSSASLARSFHVDTGWIAKRLDEWGVPRRDRSAAAVVRGPGVPPPWDFRPRHIGPFRGQHGGATRSVAGGGGHPGRLSASLSAADRPPEVLTAAQRKEVRS